MATFTSNVFEASVVTNPSETTPLWAADYSTGDFTQWKWTANPDVVYFYLVPSYGRPIQYGNQNASHIGNGDLLSLVAKTARTVDGIFYPEGPVVLGDYAAKYTIKNSANGSEPADNDPGGNLSTRRRTEIQYMTPIKNLYDEAKHFEERWFRHSVYLPSDFQRASGSWFYVFQIKENRAQGSPQFAIEINNNNVWQLWHRWSTTFDPISNSDPWQWGMFYTSNYDGQSYPRSTNWPDGVAHFPNEADSIASLGNVYKGGWTHWLIKARFDNRTVAQGGTGYLEVYKKDDQPWTKILSITPGNTTRGGINFDHGIGYAGTHCGPTAGLYCDKSAAWNAPNNVVIYQDCSAVFDGIEPMSNVSHDGTSI